MWGVNQTRHTDEKKDNPRIFFFNLRHYQVQLIQNHKMYHKLHTLYYHLENDI